MNKNSEYQKWWAKFATMIDIALSEGGDLDFEQGDLKLEDATNQNQFLILVSNKGEWKEHPEVGVGIIDMLSNENYNEVLVDAKRNLEYDGMKVENIRFRPDGKLILNAKYIPDGQKD